MARQEDDCELCGESTAPGSGKWVNRLGFNDGWACEECMATECDRCREPIGLDEDVRGANGNRVHESCLTNHELESDRDYGTQVLVCKACEYFERVSADGVRQGNSG